MRTYIYCSDSETKKNISKSIFLIMGSQKTQLGFIFLIWASLTTLSYSLLDEFSIVNSEELVSDKRAVELFQRWRAKHQKVYKNVEEVEKRFDNFRRNLKYVAEANTKKKATGKGHNVGLNKFADMTNDEFKAMYMSKVRKPASKKKNVQPMRLNGKARSCEAPSSLDWRKKGVVTGVKDQGQCGSCWAFSSTGAIEGVNAIVSGDLVSLSEQELVDCDSTNYGCEGGYMDYAFEWVISNGGIDSEYNYPYTSVLGNDGTCNITKEEDEKVVSIDGYEDVEASDSALLCAAATQPISVGIDGSSIDFQLYTSGVYDGECSSDPDNIDHAVLIVGYGSEDGEDYWIVKNSWGTDWGLDGYIYIRRNTDLEYGVCAINDMASYPTKDSTPSAPSPYPSPAVPPPPPPSPPPPPPPSPPPPPPPTPPGPGPSPSQCGDFSYCPGRETCCCLYEIFDFCLVYGCCEYENAVCCEGTEYCCPSDYPICDIQEGLCLKNRGDYLGIAAKKRNMAKHKFPWTKPDQSPRNAYQPLQWKRNQFAAMR